MAIAGRRRPTRSAGRLHPLGVLPFDHERNMVSVLVRDAAGALTLVTKGAPETVLDRCLDVPDAAREALAAEFAAGNRVVAVATRPSTDRAPADRRRRARPAAGRPAGLPGPAEARRRRALQRLAGLGIAVKVVTGDNAAVAVKVCHDLGLDEAAR